MIKVSQVLVLHFQRFHFFYNFQWLLIGMDLEPGRTSTMDLFFAKILNSFELLTALQKKLHCRCSTGVKSSFGFEKLSSLLLPVQNLSQENTQPENMREIYKVQRRAGKVNRTSVFAEAAVRRVLQKRFSDKFPRIHKKASVTESLF